MKIGILALQLRYNFGGILQAYALQKTLNNLGHKAVHIDQQRYVTFGSWYKKYPIYLKRAIRKYLLGENLIVRADVAVNNTIKAIATHTDPFIDKHINRIFTKDFSNIKKENFDAFVVGSDQVWRPEYFFSKIENAYLEFAKDWDVKRIAYAASFGTDEWEYNKEQTVNCAVLLKKFNAVSVRESSATVLCKEKLGAEALHVLDPTMLLEKEDYIKLFKETDTVHSDGNLLCYILDENTEKGTIINRISEEKELKPFYVNSKYNNEEASLEERIQQPVEKWLRAFFDAEFVITDSFHACVFSIIFNKPFIVYGNRERGFARFESLLNLFELGNRLVSSPSEANRVIQKSIDWESVNSIHKQLKEKSLSFLKKNLK